MPRLKTHIRRLHATKTGYQNERKLVDGCLAQDKKAWDAFVEQYARLISHAIVQTLEKYSFSTINQVVPDLFNTVFLSIIEDNSKKLRQFQWKCSLSGWLHLIAVRITVDFLRKQPEHLSLDGEAGSDGSLKDGIPDDNPLPDCLIEREQERALFDQVKNELTSKERLFVELCYSRDLPPSKIARMMNTTENNVYQLKNRVREKMKKLVAELL